MAFSFPDLRAVARGAEEGPNTRSARLDSCQSAAGGFVGVRAISVPPATPRPCLLRRAVAACDTARSGRQPRRQGRRYLACDRKSRKPMHGWADFAGRSFPLALVSRTKNLKLATHLGMTYMLEPRFSQLPIHGLLSQIPEVMISMECVFSAPGFEEFMRDGSVRDGEKNVPITEADDGGRGRCEPKAALA